MTSCSDLVSSAQAYPVSNKVWHVLPTLRPQNLIMGSDLVVLTGCIASPVSLPLSRLTFMLLLYYDWCTAFGQTNWCFGLLWYLHCIEI